MMLGAYPIASPSAPEISPSTSQNCVRHRISRRTAYGTASRESARLGVEPGLLRIRRGRSLGLAALAGEEHVIGDDLGLRPLLAVTPFEGRSAQRPFDEDAGAAVEDL